MSRRGRISAEISETDEEDLSDVSNQPVKPKQKAAPKSVMSRRSSKSRKASPMDYENELSKDKYQIEIELYMQNLLCDKSKAKDRVSKQQAALYHKKFEIV